METSLFDYDLPENLIAQVPLPERASSKLLVYNRKENSVNHRHFRDIADYFSPGDLLVLNSSKVLPARTFTQTSDGIKPAEILFLRETSPVQFEALVRPGRRFKKGSKHLLAGGKKIIVEDILLGGTRIFRFEGETDFVSFLRKHGEMPLPPYITSRDSSPDRYQTVFAREEGSVAAPTAGFHFDGNLLADIAGKGVTIEYVILHVGLGTFKPIETDNIESHKMHSERYFVSPGLAGSFQKCRQRGNKVWACGTTSVRTLEASCQPDNTLMPGWAETDIFLKPGHVFRAVDHMITNFHLPKSTLLVLVASFCEINKIRSLYQEAISKNYRFYSFGDAMVII